jgi:hypothetical protein
MAHDDGFPHGFMGPLLPNPNIPESLFNTTIPRIQKSIPEYQSLQNNTTIPLEKGHFQCSIRTQKLTPDNWEALLHPGCTVYIPITFGIVHHKVIEDYGHDKLVQLEYVGQTRLHNDFQLNFKFAIHLTMFPRYHACKAKKLDTYPYPIMVEMKPEQIQRDVLRYKIIGWRVATRKTENRMMDTLQREFLHTRMGGILTELRKMLMKRTLEEKST